MVAKNKGGSLVFWKKSDTNVGTECGWDEEITKQTGGFTSDQNPQTGAKQKQKLQPGPGEGRKHEPLSNPKKDRTIKKITGERRRRRRRKLFFLLLLLF